MSVFDQITDLVLNTFFGRSTNQIDGAARQLTEKGMDVADGGMASWVEAPPEFTATSNQTAGLWPFAVGTSSPLVGAVLGRNQLNGSVVCGDPINLFLRGIISSPSCFILGLQSRGKSSVAVRMALALVDQGFLFVGASDVKPDLAGLTVEIGGQMIRVAPGVGAINPLDAGPLWWRLHELPEALQRQMRAEIHSRRLNALTGLLELVFKAPLDARQQEPTVLSMAILQATEHTEAHGRQPLIADVVEVISSAPPAIMAAILVEDEPAYRAQVRNLLAGLNALGAHGPFGDVFCQHTTQEMQIDQSVDFDLSAIDETLLDLRAAVQIVCWSYAQAGISAAKTLAQAGLMEERHHLMIMDELWQALRASELLVHQIDGLTRLNRTKGLGQVLITHSMKDLQLSTVELTKIATGFMERSSMKILGGLAQNEMPMLEDVFPLSEQEKALLVAWSAEGTMNPQTGETNPPPGRGRFMLKTGEAPGVPFRTNLTAGEMRVHDTNAAWAEAQARATSPARVEAAVNA